MSFDFSDDKSIITVVRLQETKSTTSLKEDTSKNVEKAVARKLIIIVIVCLIFMVLEIVGGILSNSLALASDGLHLLTDLAGFIISLVSTYLAQHKPSKKMNFGFKRVEVLGALLSITSIWMITGILLYLAIIRIVYSSYEIDTKLMIVMATISVLINIVMAFVLSYSHKGGSHSHHSHSSKLVAPKIIDQSSNLAVSNLEIDEQVSKNINIRAAFIHILGDMIQSIGVLIASITIYFNSNFKIMDPMCTVLFSIIVLFTTLPILNDILNVLSESFPTSLDYDSLQKEILNINGVKEVLDLKCWYLSTNSYALNSRIILAAENSNYEFVLNELKSSLSKYNFEHINIQIENEKHRFSD